MILRDQMIVVNRFDRIDELCSHLESCKFTCTAPISPEDLREKHSIFVFVVCIVPSVLLDLLYSLPSILRSFWVIHCKVSQHLSQQRKCYSRPATVAKPYRGSNGKRPGANTGYERCRHL